MKIYNNLINSIFSFGNGKSPQSAFVVINANEEYALLDKYRLERLKQELIDIDQHSFDLLSVKDKNTNEKIEIYFNVTIPFSFLAREYKNEK